MAKPTPSAATFPQSMPFSRFATVLIFCHGDTFCHCPFNGSAGSIYITAILKSPCFCLGWPRKSQRNCKHCACTFLKISYILYARSYSRSVSFIIFFLSLLCIFKFYSHSLIITLSHYKNINFCRRKSKNSPTILLNSQL